MNSTGGTENNYLYRGEQYDQELGMQYLRQRYYDTSVGRFASVDPFSGLVELPVSRHRYMYGNANPVSYIDPSGEFSMLYAAEIIAVANILATMTLGALGTYGALWQQSVEGERSNTWTGEIATLTPGFIPYSSINWGIVSIGIGIQAGVLLDVDKADGNLDQQNGVFLLLGGSFGISAGVSTPIGGSIGEFTVKTPTLFNKARYLAGSYVLGDAAYAQQTHGFSESPFLLGFGSGDASGRNRNTDLISYSLSYNSGLSIPLRINPEGEGLLA